ncbi:AprI/Inh family metalloprotease inhibitor [Microvirga sp. ACRRW]|uniref:AprI/Inh family metalloprotease inhibitor n=1 Tax=Microvirga sp. ACRRW TaxID=2918205 RepID=UPI00351D6B64
MSPSAEFPPGVFTTPRRASSYAGIWHAKDDKGLSCSIHLSSVASLDLYKASVSKCSNESLSQVNMWRFEGGKVTLFSRGTEIARLEGAEASLAGTLSRSGAPLRMTR